LPLSVDQKIGCLAFRTCGVRLNQQATGSRYRSKKAAAHKRRREEEVIAPSPTIIYLKNKKWTIV
jgi:hypothetical protein